MTSVQYSYELPIQDITDPFFYPWWYINYFMIAWLLSHIVKLVLQNNNLTKGPFLKLDDEKQSNVVTYVMEILVTSVTFPISLIGAADICFRGYDMITSIKDMNIMLISFNLSSEVTHTCVTRIIWRTLIFHIWWHVLMFFPKTLNMNLTRI